MLCPSGEARKIGASGPSEKRSVNPTCSAARVSSLCMTALGQPVVLDVNMMCARSAALAGKGAIRFAGVVHHVPAESSKRKTPSPCPQVEAASRAMSPSRAVPWRSNDNSARAPVSRTAWATVSGSVRVGKLAGMAPRRSNATNATCPSTMFGRRRITMSPRPIPPSCSRSASRPASRHNMPWLSRRPVASATARRCSRRRTRTV